MAKQDSSVDVSGWVGWVYFGGVMMTLVGFFQMIAGFVALFNEEVYLLGPENLWILDVTSWGWAHVFLGLLVVFAGLAVLGGKTWGRVLGVLLAAMAMLANFAFIPVYPFWSILMVVVYMLVIYAFIVHGDELKYDN
jgi:hypothetical protein